MRLNANQNICDYHKIIQDKSNEISKLKAKNYETVEDLLDEVQSLADDIYSIVDYALEAGQRMENRLKDYKNTIEGLGFERVK